MPVPIKKFSAEYNWREDDRSIPPGWRSAVINMNSFGKIVESIRYLAPDGRYGVVGGEFIKITIIFTQGERIGLYLRKGVYCINTDPCAMKN